MDVNKLVGFLGNKFMFKSHVLRCWVKVIMSNRLKFIPEHNFPTFSIFRIYHVIAATQLRSWNVTVQQHGSSARLDWSGFPLSDPIQDLYMAFKQADEEIIVLIPTAIHNSGDDIDFLLMPGRQYIIQMIAFMGSIGDYIYSSNNVSITTEEGGM